MSRQTADQRRLPAPSDRIPRSEAWVAVLKNTGLIVDTVNEVVDNVTHHSPVFGLPPDEIKDEAFGAAYEGALRAVETFDPERGFTFSTYAVKVIRNQIFGALEVMFLAQGAGLARKGETGAFFVPLEEARGRPDDGQRFEERIEERVDYETRKSDGWRCIDELPDKEAAVMRLFASGLSRDEVAAALGMTKNQVKWCLKHARKRASRNHAELAA